MLKPFLILISVGFCAISPFKSLSADKISANHQTDTIAISKESFVPLITYMEKAIRYPATARQNGTQGNVIVSFDLLSDGTIANVKPLDAEALSKNGDGIDTETIRVLKAFQDKKKQLRPGNYLLPVTFVLQGGNTPPPAISPEMRKQPNCLYQILITTIGGNR